MKGDQGAYDAIVIGGGANGLVAAAALGRSGRRVLVVERDQMLGGPSAAREFSPGFSAPMSPDGGWLPRSVAQGLKLAVPPMTRPTISLSVAVEPGSFLSLATDAITASDTLRPYSPRDADMWSPFVHQAHRLAEFLGALYQLPPPDLDTDSLREVLPFIGLGRKFRKLGRIDMTALLRVLPMPVQDVLDDVFELEPLKAAVGAGGIRDIRQGPRSGGTTFVMLHHLVGAPVGASRARAWWRDGPDAFVDAVAMLAKQHHVVIRTGADVARILVHDDAARGVVLAGGEEINAPVVVSTADPARTMLRLVDPVWLDPEFLRAVGNIKFRGCTAIAKYALAGLPHVPGFANATQALASVVSLTNTLDGLERAFDAAKYGRVSRAPHIEVTVPTLRWPSLAPAGRHVLVATAQYAPHELRGHGTWDPERSDDLLDTVTAAIGRAFPGFQDLVLDRVLVSPDDLETDFGLTEGAMTHGEMTLDQILFMRPVAGWGRYAMPIAGLYLGGAGTHPGAGVLGGPGWLAAQRILVDRTGGKKEKGHSR